MPEISETLRDLADKAADDHRRLQDALKEATALREENLRLRTRVIALEQKCEGLHKEVCSFPAVFTNSG